MIKKPLVEAAARLGITLSVAVVTGKADRAGYERVFDAMEKRSGRWSLGWREQREPNSKECGTREGC
jgi:hypothetical protein